MFSRAVYEKALWAPRPRLLTGDPTEEDEITTWSATSSSDPTVTYVVLTDGQDLLTCTCRWGQTRGEDEKAECSHAASVLIEMIRRNDEE
jgi:hypothetical protein